MRRRSFAALLAALAGCSTPSSRSPTETPTRTSTDTPSPSPGETPFPPGDSVFDGAADCPPDVQHCFHEATADSPAFVRPSAERISHGDIVRFSLVNRSEARLSFGPYYWDVWRRTATGWQSVDDRDRVLDLGYRLETGESYTWVAEVSASGGSVHPADSNSQVSTVGFEPSLYCFGISSVSRVAGTTESPSKTSLGTFGALFEVER